MIPNPVCLRMLAGLKNYPDPWADPKRDLGDQNWGISFLDPLGALGISDHVWVLEPAC